MALPRAHHPLHQLDRPRHVALVDGVGEVPRRDAPGARQEGGHVVGTQAGARGERPLEDLDDAHEGTGTIWTA